MASSSTQRTISSSSLITQWKYDVFLSFRGEDTRMNFTDHLYAALIRNGVYTFRDERGLEKGKYIGPGLFKAIEGSRFSIIILSKNYASSKWCLNELVKIVECMEKMGQVVFPIFYDVSPSEVRNQTGHFQEGFAKHENDFRDDQEMVRGWRAAMTKVGNLKGYHVENRHESEFIQDIVKEISSKLSPILSSHVNQFVGMDLRYEKLRLKIDVGLSDVRFVGICGMGGIGKTTLARVVYNQMSCDFEGSSFLLNVREVSQQGHLVSLQERLLSQILKESSCSVWDVDDGINMIRSRLYHKKVLVIIDDVDDIGQLKKLTGNHDWFGLGSRIIITTRDEHLLIAHGVDVVYKVEGLHHDEALQLFSLKAFKKDHPPSDYVELSKHVIEYADGLPLALEIFGSFLCDRRIDEWENVLERLDDSEKEIIDGHQKIMDRLQISFDGLEETYQRIFLDIACFFKGKHRDYVTKILDNNIIGINVLIEKCLIAISNNNNLWMHDLLQEMAKKIVQNDSPKELGKRTRLWDKKDIHHMLMNNLGTEAVEGIILKFSEQEELPLSAKAFSNMNKLRVLQIHNVKLSKGLDYLSNELRFLEWQRYPLKSMPSSFQPDKIVALNLCYSSIQQLWKGIKRPLNKLKFINLSHSVNLTVMPDFIWIPNLESLILEGCTRISELHPSIGVLKRLILLNLKDCKSLSSFPSSIKLESLEVCTLAGCSKLKEFPGIICEMTSLKKLDVSGTTIEQLPPSIFQLMKNVEELSLRGCKGPPHKSWSPFQLMKRRRLDPMPLRFPSLSVLCCLKSLDLSDCNLGEGAIPNDLGLLSSLEDLNLSGNNFVSLPASFKQLLNLKYLFLENCKSLKSMPELPPYINDISSCYCSSLERAKTLFNALKSIDDNCSFAAGLDNCFKLFENEGGSNMEFSMIKRLPQQKSKAALRMVSPRSEIPKWFSHQSVRASTRRARTTLFDNNDDKIIVVATCSVFVVHENPRSVKEYGFNYSLNGRVTTIDNNVWWDNELGQVLSDHCCIDFHPGDSSDLKGEEFSIEVNTYGQGLEVKKFGIRFIYEHEVEEFSQIMNQCNSSTFENFNDFRQDLDKSTLDCAKIKKIHDKRDEERDGRRRKFSVIPTYLGASWEDL